MEGGKEEEITQLEAGVSALNSWIGETGEESCNLGGIKWYVASACSHALWDN